MGKEVDRVDWMVWRRERRGGAMVFEVGEGLDSCFGEREDFVSGSTLCEVPGFVGVASLWTEGSSLADRSWFKACSSFCDEGMNSGMGILGVGKSLYAIWCPISHRGGRIWE